MLSVKKIVEAIQISQRVYIIQILEKFGMLKYKPRSISLPIRISYSLNNGLKTEEEKEKIKNVSYYEAPRLLMQLQIATQLNLSFVVNLFF